MNTAVGITGYVPASTSDFDTGSSLADTFEIPNGRVQDANLVDSLERWVYEDTLLFGESAGSSEQTEQTT